MKQISFKIKNPLLKKIIGIIFIAGCIELFSLVLTIFINNAQQKNYEEILDKEYSIIRDINEIMISAYQTKNLVVNYANNTNMQEDYQVEITQKTAYMEEYINALNTDANTSEKSVFVERLPEINSQYEKYEKNLASIINSISSGVNVTVEEIDAQIGDPINRIVQCCDVIRMYADIAETEKNGNIVKLNAIQKIIELFVVVITVGSILMCIYISKKNGQEMAQNQANAEKRAVSNAKKAYTDNLTGLWNRAYTERAVTRIIQSNGTGCLFMIDMDNFKSVNDTYGHIAGDDVLKAFASALKQNARGNDICCRVGGDEFMMFVQNIEETTSVNIANRLMSTAKKRLESLDGGKFVTVSIGGAMVEEDVHTFKELYDMADAALETVKDNGKAGYKLYDLSDKREKGIDRPEKNSRKYSRL